MTSRSHPDASGQQYVASDAAEQGSVTFTVNLAEAGDYVIWARVLAPTLSQNSFFVSVDGGEKQVFHLAEDSIGVWQWNVVHGRAGGAGSTLNPRIFTLPSGTHSITFRAREAGAGLDQIFVTNDLAFAPNQAPVVDAGANRSVRVSSIITLNGTVTDDGLANPPGMVATTWSKVNGPGVVTFGDASNVDTTVSFTQTGAHVLRLEAQDGEFTTSDEVTINVIDTQVDLTGFFVSPEGTSGGDGNAQSPWDLQTALSHPDSVQPGDTVRLSGGPTAADSEAD
jgi:hypothetical protein